MAFTWTVARRERLAKAVSHFNQIVARTGHKVPLEDPTLIISDTNTRREYEKTINRLENLRPEALTTMVNFRGVKVSKYERQQVLNQIQSINYWRRQRVKELSRFSKEQLSYVGAEELEVLKRTKKLPQQFNSIRDFERFMDTLVKQMDRRNFGDQILFENYKTVLDHSNIPRDLVDRIKELMNQLTYHEFYLVYITTPIETTYVYGEEQGRKKGNSIISDLERAIPEIKNIE